MGQTKPESSNASSGGLPAGFVAIPFLPDQQEAILRLCLVVREKADAAVGHLVLLRDMVDARAYLGCLLDAGGAVQKWIEVWVQDTSGLEVSPVAREALSNDVLDRRWQSCVSAYQNTTPELVIQTGLEDRRSGPIYLDLDQRIAYAPADPDTGARWSLCTDDAVLGAAGLPPYASSLHRYLVSDGPKDSARFVPLTKNAPTNARCAPPTVLSSGVANAAAFNRSGSYILVRVADPISYEAFADLLAGGEWEGVPSGKEMFDFGGLVQRVKGRRADLPDDGRLLITQEGSSAKLCEALYLKLRLLHDSIAAVRDLVQETQRPLLNLSPDSFGVSFGPPAEALPFLWTARTALRNPGDAVAIHVPGSDHEYYLPAHKHLFPIYRAPVSAYSTGRGSTRIPRVIPDSGGSAVLELTFITQERVDPSPNDLIRLRLNLGEESVDLYARAERDPALAPGEWRLRTLQQKFSPSALEQLKASEGVEIPGVVFEIVPLLSTPCDLYALAVLAVRTLLVNHNVTLPVALDKLLSLGRHAANDPDTQQTLSQRLAAIFKRDARWLQHLGPQQLLRETITPEVAIELIPQRLWFDTLAMIVPMFPALGRDSIARDYGDAPAKGIHRVFERPLADLKQLLVRSRSLIIADWNLNKEVREVISRQAGRLAQATSNDGAGARAPQQSAQAPPKPPAGARAK